MSAGALGPPGRITPPRPAWEQRLERFLFISMMVLGVIAAVMWAVVLVEIRVGW